MQRIWIAARKDAEFFCVSGRNPAPLLQLEESVFDKMAEFVKIFVVSPLLLPILL